MNNIHIGSSFDQILKDEDLLAHSEAVAIKRVIALQIEAEMRRTNITKMEMARRMQTSRSGLDRLLDPDNPSVTLLTLGRAAAILGRKLSIELT